MAAKEQIENRKNFCKKVEDEMRKEIEWEKENGPSPIRVELAMRKFHNLPRRFIEMVMDNYYPEATRRFALDVVEMMVDISETSNDEVLSLNPQRIEWLKRWANSKPMDELQQLDEPDVFKTDGGREAINKAVECGLMERKDNGYDWKETKTLLAYFVGRIVCGDRKCGKEAYSVWAAQPKGNFPNFPTKYVCATFTIKGENAKGIDKLRMNHFLRSGGCPRGWEKVEECISNC